MMQKCFRKAVGNNFLMRSLATAKKTVTITVDGKKIQAAAGSFLIDAIRAAGIEVPSMCYHSDTPKSGGICRICTVEDLGRNNALVISCRTPVEEGMNISTKSQRLNSLRQTNTALMFNTHPSTCLTCPSNTKCETQDQASKMNIHGCGHKDIMYSGSTNNTIDHTTVLNRNMDLCIGCDRCIQACSTQCNVYEWTNQGHHSVDTFGPMKSNECIQCGQCINRCPTGALRERPEIDPVMEALGDPNKHVVFQIAPAIRAAIGEEFGLKAGEKILKNELVTGLKALGKNVTVLDTDFGADLTIMEEASEFVERVSRLVLKKPYISPDAEYCTELPMFTSCCPGWVNFMEKNYPEFLPNMSTCKSPMQMQSALIKTYWAEKVKKVDPKNVVVVAIMPCSAKKEEKDRADMRTKEFKWTDYIWTNRELAKVFKQAGLDPTKLPKTDFDKTMGVSTGAGVIFGATGGVLEAALRTAYEMITGRPVPFKNLDIMPIRGFEGVREAKMKLENVKPEFAGLEGFEVKVAVAHQIVHARACVEIIKAAKLKGEQPPWHLVEVMACPGGCLGGGGQPKPTSQPIREARAKLIYQEDRDLPLRKSHDNPEIKDMYANFLKHPLSHKAHDLLHRHYDPNRLKHTATFDANEAAGIEEILAKYEPKKHENLLPIIIDETDRKGYLSNASVAKIASHIGVNPGRVNAVVSNYHYFPRKKGEDTHLYLCMCHNCMMKGQEKNYQMLKELKKSVGFELHKMNWLGVCVNDAPAAMIKRAGTNYVEYLMGLKDSTLEEKIRNLANHASKVPIDKIVTFPFSRHNPGFEHSSMLENFPDQLISDAVNKSFKIGGDKVIEKLMNAKLEGRGGAGFPTFRKWDTVRKIQSDNKYIVCNADEGLPSTFKDWWILKNENSRKRMISGMGICAKTVGAKNAFIYLRYEYRNLVPELNKTIENVKQQHPELSDIKFQIRLGGGPYVAGEETAQFESIQGEAPLPRKDRPWNVFATHKGLFNAPTVINNVETYFAVPYIIHHKESDIKKAGLPKLLGVTGNIENPVLLEYPLHADPKPTLEKIISEIGAKDIVAAEVGGETEPLILKKDFNKPIGFGWGVLNAVGSFVLFNSSQDLSEIYLRKMEFMVNESCKQCVPCRDGSKVLRDAIKLAIEKKDQKVSRATIKKVAEAAAVTSICAHGKALGPLFTAAYSHVMNA